jgi:serine-type D-Ala-D-Ala carboxypeptidase (penicillin-binding protein 5/6)
VKLVALLGAAALAAVAAPGPASATPVPPVTAHAYLVVDARTGEVLASSHAHEHLPIASITKLMTVHLALQRHRLTDMVTVDPRAAAVGESTAELEPGERLTVRDLVKAALIQSANDAADALALADAPSFQAYAALMNAEAAKLGLHDSHFVRPDGLDAPGEYSSAADATRLARIVMRTRFVRDTVREATDTIAGGRTLHTWDDLLSIFPETIGVKTGHTDAAGWCQVAAAREPGVTVYATLLGSPSRTERNTDLESLLVWGLGQFRVLPIVQAGRTYATVRLPYGRAPLRLVAARELRTVTRVDRPLFERVVAVSVTSLPVRAGTPLGTVEIWSGGHLVGRRALVAARTVRAPPLGARLGWYAGRALHDLGSLF